jgi:hypothetical protein
MRHDILDNLAENVHMHKLNGRAIMPQYCI